MLSQYLGLDIDNIQARDDSIPLRESKSCVTYQGLYSENNHNFYLILIVVASLKSSQYVLLIGACRAKIALGRMRRTR